MRIFYFIAHFILNIGASTANGLIFFSLGFIIVIVVVVVVVVVVDVVIVLSRY